ncbi:hypothetical protein SpCBS45565_g00147 [Spizellomyces sp. 'palustris']|nr:hypothetical protein SpCBS45565_g00147 [Spizellomyces sp. 'palustris']
MHRQEFANTYMRIHGGRLSPGTSTKRPEIQLFYAMACLLGFDMMGPKFLRLHYWRGIKEALSTIGCDVLITRVPRAADVSVRARVLKEVLEAKVPEGNTVNLVAHSMGGLDCRYMISHLLKPDRSRPKFNVSSLTTIGTPHHGSSIASLPFISTLLEPVISTLYRSTSLDIRAFTDLTPSYVNNTFNPTTPNDPNVSYFSYGADGTESIYQKPFVYPLRFTFEYLMAVEGTNDGLVSVKSAQWGEYIKTLKADHIDLINLLNTWRWETVVKNLDAVEKVEEALKQGTEVKGQDVRQAHTQLQKKAREIGKDLVEHTQDKKEELKDQIEESKFNAIELYLEIATMLANKGF